MQLAITLISHDVAEQFICQDKPESVRQTVTLSGSHVWRQWAGRLGTATLRQECGTAPVADRTSGRPCCTHHRGWVSHRRLEEISIYHQTELCFNIFPSFTYNLSLILSFLFNYSGHHSLLRPKNFFNISLVFQFVMSSYRDRFTCRPAGTPILYVDLPDTTSLFCSELAAVALFGSGLRLHQLQHRRVLPEH